MLLKAFDISTTPPRQDRITVKDIAQEYGYSPGTIYNWRGGYHIPRTKLVNVNRMKSCMARIYGKSVPMQLKKYSLWDLWELVRERWKKLRRELHPDVSGKHYACFGKMSHIYDTIMLRFKARGIG